LPEKIGHFYEFGGFRLDAENHGLWLDDKLVAIAPKSLELLILLVYRRGNIVSREELLETIWRDTFVEEANINYTVSQLRKVLGENCPDKAPFVQTVPKQGYRFAAEVREVFETDQKAENSAELPDNILPPPAQKSQIRWHFIAIILLGVLLLTSFAAWWNFADRRGLSNVAVNGRNIRTVAVLPLKTLTEGEPGKELALGLTDTLISRLGSLNRFAVRPLTSVKAYAESNKDPLKFGETLKVDAVLEGTLQQAAGRLRVNARLWDARDGAQLWQDSFDAAETDFFDLQDKLATRVTQSLVSNLLEKDRELLTRRDTGSTEAFRAYTRGRAIMDSKNADSAEKALDEFNKAATLDPAFALSYVGIADAFSRLGFAASGKQADEFFAKAKSAANKALALDPDSTEACAALGSIARIRDWDWAVAEKNFKRAIELNPNYAKAHVWYALLLSQRARNDEALTEIKRAMQIDPLSQDVKSGYLTILEGRGEYAEALTQALENQKLNKEYRRGLRGVATFSFHLGDYARVIEIGERELTEKDSQKFAWLSLLTAAYHRTGQAEKRDEKLKQNEELAQTDSKALYGLAENYAELGRFNEAIAVLEKCFELREERLMWLKVEPRFAALRNDPRFQEMLRRINLAG
jgi:DNA-binding winged helix-turn-helix (wHTH) protein/TolB-like protein/Tfp pilus assembly protein PilF